MSEPERPYNPCAICGEFVDAFEADEYGWHPDCTAAADATIRSAVARDFYMQGEIDSEETRQKTTLAFAAHKPI